MKNIAKIFLILALMLGLSAVPAFAETYSASENAIDLITKFDRCVLTAEKEPSGLWTVGYRCAKNVTADTVLANEDEARALLRESLKTYAYQVNALAANGCIKFELNQNRFDALVSFAFNCGSGIIRCKARILHNNLRTIRKVKRFPWEICRIWAISGIFRADLPIWGEFSIPTFVESIYSDVP